jgi:hypothetical protein
MPVESRLRMSQSRVDETVVLLKEEAEPATVPRMPSRSHRQRQGARARARHARAVRRARTIALVAVFAVLSIVVLLVGAWSPSRAPAEATAGALGGANAKPLPTGLPKPVVVAQVPGSTPLPLKLPIAAGAITAIGYHAAAGLGLKPYGHRVNEGALSHLWHRVFGGNTRGLRYFQLAGGTGAETAELDVGAAPGTDVYSPLDGTVVGITPLIVDGTQYGVRLDIRSDAAPSVVVSVSHLAVDPSLAIGSALTASVSRIGQVIALSRIEKQALAHYTQDQGDHAAITARIDATLAP